MKYIRVVRVLVVAAVLGTSGACQQQPRQRAAEEETRIMMPVRERVKQIIAEQLGVDEAEVTDTVSIVDDLGADSLDTVELVMTFEEAFNIEIPDEEAEKIRTVKDAVEYIERKR